jgi:solute:Na+ symporter, SSS family
MIKLNYIDASIIIAYLAAVSWLGFRVKSRVKGMEDYVVMGRRLTLPLFVGTLVATWYGGILGVGEISFSSGIVNWVTQGFFWYLSYLVFAFFLSEKLNKSRQKTLPDQLDLYYGSKARVFGSLFNFLNVVPIVYILELGIIFKLFFNLPLSSGIILAGAFALFCTVLAGLYSDAYTNFIQFFFMCTTIPIILICSVIKFGGYGFLANKVPTSHFSLTGNFSIGELIVWGFLAMGTLVDPNFYQRCYAAGKPKIAKSGILLSIFFWFLFDICTTFIGIYARAVIPNVSDAKLSFPLFADYILPVGLKGLCFTGIIATVMSTVDSYCLVGGVTLAHDLYHKYINRNASEETLVKVSRIGVFLTCVIGVVFALIYNTSIKTLWYVIGSITFSVLFFPVLAGIFIIKRGKSRGGFPSMIFGALGSIGWFVLQNCNLPGRIASTVKLIDALYVGLLASIAGFFIFHKRYEDKQ